MSIQIRHDQSLNEMLDRLEAEGAEKHKRMSSFEQELIYRARKKGVPLHGKFELTPLCTLDCKMCYIHLHKEQMHGAELLPTEQWKSLMKQAADMGMMDASLTGGECLLYPGFDELYLYLRSLGVSPTVLTNGTLLTEERVAFFKAHPPKLIQVTLYGSNDDAYEQVTGHRSFQAVINGIRMLKEAGIRFMVMLTPNAFMDLEDAKRMMDLLHSMGVLFGINSMLIMPYEETGRAKKKMEYDIDVENYIALYKYRASLLGFTHTPFCEDDFIDIVDENDKGRGLLCSGGRAAFCITWDGKMQPCSGLHKLQQLPFRDGFAEAWKKLNAQCEDYPRLVECTDCKLKCVCILCPIDHEMDAPVGHASQRICHYFHRLVEEQLI